MLAAILVALLAAGGRGLATAKEKTEKASAPDPDRSLGGYDIWTTRQKGDGSWTVPVNLGPSVNSTLREVSPAVSPDGKWLYFATKDRPDGTGNEDIYVCARDGNGWGPARNLGPAVNTMWEEIGPCPFPDGKSLMFSRRDPTQKSYDLAVTVRVEGEWLEAIGVGTPLATPGEERLPSITADGKELYFCALWRAGQGSFDIWESYRDDRGSWSEPVELGLRVNSRDSDYSPGISPDGRRLFFASKRGGSDNFDLYVSERKEGGTWQEAVPLPAPVNTPRYTEYCPSVGPDGKTLYFASDRPQGAVTVTEEE
jgi:Tol biopolymer transport system component